MSEKVYVFPQGSLRKLPVHTEPSSKHASNCTSCAINPSARSVCLRPEGTPGGLLIIGDYPSYEDDAQGRPLISPEGMWLRTLIHKHWAGAWAMTSALSCTPAGDVKALHIDACRKHVVRVLEDTHPTLIMLLGPWAALSVFGEKYKPLTSRGGFGWWQNPATGKMVPVVMLPLLSQVPRNTLIARVFTEDFIAAITRWKNKRFQPPDESLFVELVDAQNVHRVRKDLLEGDYVGFDTETSGIMYTPSFRIECIVLWCVRDGLPHKGFLWDREQIEHVDLRAPLRDLLHNPQCKKVGFNSKYDIQAVFSEPLLAGFRGFHSDARLKRKLLAADADGSLAACAHLVGIVGHKSETAGIVSVLCADLNRLAKYRANSQLVGVKPAKMPLLNMLNPADVPWDTTDALTAGHEPEKFAYRYIPRDVRRRYCALDVLSTILVEEWADEQIGQGQLRPVWEEITRPATLAMVEMERHGICVDVQKLQMFSSLLGHKIKAELARIEACSPGINPASPVQVAAAIGKLGLVIKSKTPTGAISTSEQALEALKGKHIFIDSLLEFRRLSKLQSTYADGYQIYVQRGRIRTSYLLDGAASGRPSSSNPNMSVLPRPVDAEGNTEGQLLRECFVAPPDHVLMEVDRKQIEIYIAAWLSKDPVMMEMLTRPGADFHMEAARMASQVAWGIKPEEVTKQHRQEMKTSVFAVLYELPEKLGWLLSKRLKCSVAQGEKLADALFGNFKRLKEWMQEKLTFARQHGYTETEWNNLPARQRMLWAIGDTTDRGKGERENAERSAWNSPVQGGAADFTTADLYPVMLELGYEGLRCYPILTIYDSIIFEVHKDDLQASADVVRRVMSDHDLHPLKLAVDVKYGPTLGTMEELGSVRV